MYLIKKCQTLFRRHVFTIELNNMLNTSFCNFSIIYKKEITCFKKTTQRI